MQMSLRGRYAEYPVPGVFSHKPVISSKRITTMPYVANVSDAEARKGQFIGNGQCVTFVHAAVSIPPTVAWHKGEKVKDVTSLRPGTVIATFDKNGQYGNHTNGSSHAAIYLGQDLSGIKVLDQWSGPKANPVHERTIRFMNGRGFKVNDGDQFYVVE